MPRFGFGDPKSYSVMEMAVKRVQENGAVRHGPECFNYYFPQDLDEEYLVISDTLDGPVPWKYVDLDDLQDLLYDAILDGFTFPINPKWVLVDPGWKRVWDCLMQSEHINTKESLNVWFPPSSRIRERVNSISKNHGGNRRNTIGGIATNKEAERDLAMQKLERYINLQRAKKKMRAIMYAQVFLKGWQK